MKCFRCGDCCIRVVVAVLINPEKATQEYKRTGMIGWEHDNIYIVRGDGIPCIHLKGDGPGQYHCAIHHFPWFKFTPCYTHKNYEYFPGQKCSVGEHIVNVRGGEPLPVFKG